MKTKLRLLTISHMFPSRQLPRHGIFLQRQARALVAHGIECTFLVPRPIAPWPLNRFSRWQVYGPNNPLLTEDTPEVVCRRYLRCPGHWYRRCEGRAQALALSATAQTLHQRKPFDAIWAAPMIPDGIAGVHLKTQLHLPLITLAIGSDVLVYPQRMPALQDQLRDGLPQVDLAVGVSQAVCDCLSEFGARDPLCVYLARDIQSFVPALNKRDLRAKIGLPAESIVAVFVGRLASNKGIAELAQVTRALAPRYPQFRVVCVGDGPARRTMAALGERVLLAGERPPETVPTYLQAADFMVLPSYSEGMPQVVLEAMGCALPIVATDVGGISEAVVEGDNGLLVQARDAAQLTVAMERMITDTEFRQQAGQRSRAIAMERFDSETNTQRLADALVAVARRG